MDETFLKLPRLIKLPRIGEPSLGYISVAEKENLDFKVNRVYWTYYTPEMVLRGRHAHYVLEQLLIAVAGKILVHTEMPNGLINDFILDSPDKAVYLPKLCWHTMQYSHNSVQMCIANTAYDEADYIRDYETFKTIQLK